MWLKLPSGIEIEIMTNKGYELDVNTSNDRTDCDVCFRFNSTVGDIAELQKELNNDKAKIDF